VGALTPRAIMPMSACDTGGALRALRACGVGIATAAPTRWLKPLMARIPALCR